MNSLLLSLEAFGSPQTILAKSALTRRFLKELTVNTKDFGTRACVVGVMLLLTACGGGGSNSGDTSPSAAPVASGSGLDRFLVFPNPQVQPDKSFQTISVAYATAYYAAIDPNNEKDTLEKWKAANGFDSGTGIQKTVVFGDQRDLGYGRLMTGRQNPDGTIAFFVENYVTNPGEAYGYSPLSLEAAIARDTRWRIGYNAIEFSPGPDGGEKFAKFFNFNAASEQRELMVDLDFRGAKAMPGPCITCHGGRGDALAADGRFNQVENTVSKARGDVQGHLQPFEVDSFDFSQGRAGFTRSDQELALKTLNQMVLCTYPVALDSPESPCDALPAGMRRKAQFGEWQGTADQLIKAAYGGDGMPNASYSDTFVPEGWSSVGQTTLYKEVVAQSCRVCHILRGVVAQPDDVPIVGPSEIDFTTFAKFQAYSDRIKAHVIDRGNMPLDKLVYDAFWAPNSNKPELLATFLEGEGFTNVRDAKGTVLQPGRPIADPGPDRVVTQGSAELSAEGSLFADIYRWSIVSGPDGIIPPTGVSLIGANSAEPIFTASVDGTFVLQLVAAKGFIQSDPARLTVVVKSQLSPAPAEIRFSDIQRVLGQTKLQGDSFDACISCHSLGGTKPTPVFYGKDGTSVDVDYETIRGRINFTDIVASPLLRKPSGNHHGAGDAPRPGFNASMPPGHGERENYDLFLNWILNGAPR